MTRPLLSIVMCTARPDPGSLLFFESLESAARYHPDITYEVIVIDKLLWDKPLSEQPQGLRRVPPKPTVWQGPHRKTSKDYWAKANALNTAIVLANGQQLVFIDDCMIVNGTWLLSHAYYAKMQRAVAGRCISIKNPQTKDGALELFDLVSADDVRMQQVPPDGKPVHCSGTWLFGSNFSVPLYYAYKLNGFDENYDGQRGFEDIDFGARLERTACSIQFDPRCIVYQVMDTHTEAPPDAGDNQKVNNRQLLYNLTRERRRYRASHPIDLHVLRRDLDDGHAEWPPPWGPEIDPRSRRLVKEL